MASRGVSALKFVGTVSLGLLTGLSYTLSTLTVPTLLTLPSASTAANAFRSLTATARTHLRALAGVSGAAFLLAFALSPRAARHPYLLYTSTLVAVSRLAVSDPVAPYLFASSSSSSSAAAAQKKKQQQSRKERSAARRMEASYDVIGPDSEAAPDSASDRSADDDNQQQQQQQQHAADDGGSVNGEEVRGEVEAFLKKQAVSTAVAGLGFLLAVVGIWGDGAVAVVETVVNVVEF